MCLGQGTCPRVAPLSFLLPLLCQSPLCLSTWLFCKAPPLPGILTHEIGTFARCPGLRGLPFPSPFSSDSITGTQPSTGLLWSLSLLANKWFFFLNLFIFGCPGSSLPRAGFSLVAASWGYSSLQCVGFSLRWLLLLRSTGSRRAGFSSCGSRSLERRLSSCGARA